MSPVTLSVMVEGELPTRRNSRVVPPVACMTRLLATAVKLPVWFQEPANVATLIFSVPQVTAGKPTGPVPPLAHFWISTVLPGPQVREALPGKSLALPALLLPMAL